MVSALPAGKSYKQNVLLRLPRPFGSSSLLCKLLCILPSDTGLLLVTSGLTYLLPRLACLTLPVHCQHLSLSLLWLYAHKKIN